MFVSYPPDAVFLFAQKTNSARIPSEAWENCDRAYLVSLGRAQALKRAMALSSNLRPKPGFSGSIACKMTNMLRYFLLALLISAAKPDLVFAQQRSGIDLSAIDGDVRPQEDFWRFANGKWLAATSIPSDRPVVRVASPRIRA
jgi:hypothetical protein